ncbi:Rap1-interacting factor 1 N terminal-domain-containing protein [Clohesyomyces aquaticus]|uniref:Rap1-interacting factor 1 N terminal-domain-containing protein n=1 Tax=Clohesyomyces aquaticus TaxID=1231657 RepID=A0A1Y1Z1S3_9PLEO|nr:Rap1-interacting factor 1 N terminal-domain-containing protein [Clohesyomyces aquaticus]
MVFSTSKFQTFRPPTPPRELDKDAAVDVDEVLQFLDDPFGTKTLLDPISAASTSISKPLLNTPEQSPSSDAANASDSSSNRKKRVNFEIPTCTTPTTSLAAREWTPLRSSPLRPLPQTRVNRPLKSILKAFEPSATPPVNDQSTTASQFESFADMLESMVRMLAQGARPSKLDAYITLHGTMQAYDKVPDIQALASKMGLLAQFVKRDIQAPGIGGSGFDSPLVQQACKFLMVLLRIPDLKPAMDDEFCSFVVDRCIQVATDPIVPKSIVNHHLAILMQQNFRPRVMTVARVEKITDALETVDERVTGYSVKAYRIRVYRKLIQQRPELMSKHTEKWFKHTLQASLTSQKDINQSALETALCAAKTFSTDTHVAKTVLSMLNRVKEETTVGKVVTQELKKMLESEAAPLVPQIWGVLTALLRKSGDINQFIAIQDWLNLLQNFFNSKNEQVKVNANVAVSFLIYAVNLTQNTSQVWLDIFLNIHRQQIQRRNQWKRSEGEVVTASYLTLLYYGLRPTAPHEQLDRYWTQFVADFWKPLVHSHSPKYALVACRIVSGLLNGSRKPWNEERVLEIKSQGIVQRGELPLLDPKWVRKSLASILKFVETLLDAAPWWLEAGEDEPAKTMWLALLGSLVEASSKEVMASTETKDALAHIVNMLRRIWDRHTSELAIAQQKEDSWANKFCFLLETVLQSFGPLQFADKCLSRNEENDIELAATPSNRSRQHGPRISPLLYFVDLLINRSEGKISDEVRLRIVQLVLDPCLRARKTRLAKLELLRDCSTAVSSSSNNSVTASFWARLASATKDCIEEGSSDVNEQKSRQLGKEYELVVDILAMGSGHLLTAPAGCQLLNSFVSAVRLEAGEGAVVLAVIEKVSDQVLRYLGESDGSACVPLATILLRNSPMSIARRNLEQARQSLWPSSQAPARSHEFNPYNHFYAAIAAIGSTSYRDFQVRSSETLRDFFPALAHSIRGCSLSYLAVYLRSIQRGIAPWIEDSDRKLQDRDQNVKLLYPEVLKLWQDVSGALQRLPRKDNSILVVLEPIITAGFSSRRRGIVNASISAWNTTFGKEEALRYPVRLEHALQRLRGTVELCLPSLAPNADGENDSDDNLSFYESDSPAIDTGNGFGSPRVRSSPFRMVKNSRSSRSPAAPISANRRIPSRQTPKIRLRHEDSQIKFEPIVSSPSNPLDQKSQILTERQKEMIERQRGTAHLFSDVGARTEGQPRNNHLRPSDVEFNSDPVSADELPNENSRTPLQTITAMCPMDVFLGSSPTPQARNRNQQVLRDDVDVASPKATPAVQLTNDDEQLGSSPPRFEAPLSAPTPTSKDKSDDVVRDSFDYRQREDIDDGQSLTSVEEDRMDEVFLTVVSTPSQLDEAESSEDESPIDTDSSNVASSTVDLQITAQLNAELNAQAETNPVDDPVPESVTLPESNSEYVDASSQKLHSIVTNNEDMMDQSTEVEDTQIIPGDQPGDEGTDASTTESSRVGDSFLSVAALSPQVQNLRKSSRLSVTSSPGRYSKGKKRKSETADSNSTSKKNKTAETAEPQMPQDSPQIDRSLIQIASKSKPTPSKKRGRRSTQESPDTQVVVPETTGRKQPDRRSTSLLSQMELQSEEVLVEDTPAPKRARRRASQDVGAADAAVPQDPNSQVKRLSHIQVTPKRTPSLTSSSAPRRAIGEAPTPSTRMPVSEGEQKANVARQSGTAVPPPAEQSQPQHASDTAATPNRSFAERVILTPRSVLGRLRKILSDCSQLVLGRAEEREFDDVLFDLRKTVHAAGRREEEPQ